MNLHINILLTVIGFEVEFIEEPLTASYFNPEWQANALAAELLCPYEDTKDFTLQQLMDECYISEECAIITLKMRGRTKKL